jgi:2-polyprenyl-6-methoxyphenol hydroxylase-like FAD-dependent oxidoreductase
VHEDVDVGIVGGGIAGLTAALALERSGRRPRVFERGEKLQSGKGGLLLWSNALRVLDALGVGKQVVAAGFPVRSTQFRTPDRRLLGKLPVDEMSEEAGAPTVFIERDALVTILHDALAAGTVAFGAECTGVAADEHRVELSFAAAPPLTLPVVVGADGVGSRIGAALHGKVDATDANIRAWGGTATGLDADALPAGVTYVTIGRGKRFCFAPCGPGRAFWYAAANDALGPASLATHFADFHAPIPTIIAATPAEAQFETRVRYRPPADRWGRGRVTLLGDAIHPTTPDLAQGACQAIESGAVLARALRIAADPVQALRDYEAERRRRTARVVYLSWLATTQSMRNDAMFCAARDAVTEPFLHWVARRELAWLLNPS